MKTLDHRTSKTIERTKLQMENGCNGVKQVIFFYISECYNVYADGTSDLFKTYYIKQDRREYVNIGEQDRFYETEKGYRNAIKRWTKKSI